MINLTGNKNGETEKPGSPLASQKSGDILLFT